jgi:hypothetical protein
MCGLMEQVRVQVRQKFLCHFQSPHLHFHNCFTCVNIVAAMEWSFRPKARDVSIEMNVSICHASTAEHA